MRCRKILIGFGGSTFQSQEIDFVSKYLVQDDSLVVGAFLTDLQGVATHQPCKKDGCNTSPACVNKKAQRDRAKMAAYLQQAGEQSAFRTLIRREQGTSLHEFLQESRYADLLVISQRTWRAKAATPELRAVSDLLSQCECPVLVVPDKAETFEQVVLTFDGSREAMQGIKQFLYLVPELAKDLPVTVLATYCDGCEPPAAEEKLFVEYLKQHFKGVAMHRLCEASEHTLISAVGLNERSLVIVNNPSPKELRIMHGLLNPNEEKPVPVEMFTRTDGNKLMHA